MTNKKTTINFIKNKNKPIFKESHFSHLIDIQKDNILKTGIFANFLPFYVQNKPILFDHF
ncbi:MAG: hypothetical protein DWP97_11910 [Calditrichaeota bacterium]|nr:MAG: hypothetical protein DWP97_11910 [Calditrichota bacterium]